ncbi:hypothetical protein EON65_55785 [archaeon]|nr:MAG: hypothetical protein EON65_55785 [archaeon]
MLGAVRAVLHKWKLHHTIQDLPKTGRPPIRTKRRLARMALRGDVESARELAEAAAALDIAHTSQRTARNMLHDEGLKALHTIRKPLLHTRENGWTLLWHIVIGQSNNGSKSCSLTRHLY